MKKIAYSVLIIFGIILLTGCTKNINFSKTSHIVCTKTENGYNNFGKIIKNKSLVLKK